MDVLALLRTRKKERGARRDRLRALAAAPMVAAIAPPPAGFSAASLARAVDAAVAVALSDGTQEPGAAYDAGLRKLIMAADAHGHEQLAGPTTAYEERLVAVGGERGEAMIGGPWVRLGRVGEWYVWPHVGARVRWREGGEHDTSTGRVSGQTKYTGRVSRVVYPWDDAAVWARPDGGGDEHFARLVTLEVQAPAAEIERFRAHARAAYDAHLERSQKKRVRARPARESAPASQRRARLLALASASTPAPAPAPLASRVVYPETDAPGEWAEPEGAAPSSAPASSPFKPWPGYPGRCIVCGSPRGHVSYGRPYSPHELERDGFAYLPEVGGFFVWPDVGTRVQWHEDKPKKEGRRNIIDRVRWSGLVTRVTVDPAKPKDIDVWAKPDLPRDAALRALVADDGEERRVAIESILVPTDHLWMFVNRAKNAEADRLASNPATAEIVTEDARTPYTLGHWQGYATGRAEPDPLLDLGALRQARPDLYIPRPYKPGVPDAFKPGVVEHFGAGMAAGAADRTKHPPARSAATKAEAAAAAAASPKEKV